jgi:hypothetical protein
MLGLAAVAAAAAMAFIGASAASAAVLCNETPSGSPATCPEAAVYPEGSIIEGTAVNVRFTTSLANVNCQHSTSETETHNVGGSSERVIGTLTDLTFTECQTEGLTPTNCTVTAQSLPYRVEVDWLMGTHDGTFTVKHQLASGDPAMTVMCSSLISCKLYSPQFDLPLTGGNPATITANEASIYPYEGLICPESASWDAIYQLTGTSSAVWVAKEET